MQHLKQFHFHICVMFQQKQCKLLWVLYVIDTVYSLKFCRCHCGIVIYRHACQDPESLSGSMAIAKCAAETCVWGRVSPRRLSEKTLPGRHCERLSVCTCPILLPSHSKWLFIMAGMDLTASTHLSDTAQGKLRPLFTGNQPYEGTTFWLVDWPIGSMAV